MNDKDVGLRQACATFQSKIAELELLEAQSDL